MRDSPLATLWLCLVAVAGALAADPKELPKSPASGFRLDFRGPSEARSFVQKQVKIAVEFEGGAEPYDPDFLIAGFEYNPIHFCEHVADNIRASNTKAVVYHFEREKDSPKLIFRGVTVEGKFQRVKSVTITSKVIPMDQLPKVKDLSPRG